MGAEGTTAATPCITGPEVGRRVFRAARSVAIMRRAARASRPVSVRRLALFHARLIWSCMPTMSRRTEDRTAVAAISSIKVKLATPWGFIESPL